MKRQNKRHRKVRKCLAGPNFPGQHLLHNKRVARDMVESAQITSRDLVLEIGAGKGAITLLLAEKAGKVLAVENDPIFCEILHKKAARYSNITIIQKDVMKTNLPRQPFCVVSNIPYAITTPILEKLLGHPGNALQRALLMVEEGAAKRFTADPITNPKILTWRMWFHMAIVQKVSRRNFSPPPNVDSALLSIRRKCHPSVPPHQQPIFTALANYGLKHPDWSMDAALRGIFTRPQLKRLVKHIGVDQHSPIGSLDEDQWGIVFQTMAQYVPSFRWPKMRKR